MTALAVPFIASQMAIDAAATPLIWLMALIPAFLLAYYRGWGGVATALAAAMATLAASNVVLLWRGVTIHELVLFAVVSLYIAICLGIGWLSESLHATRAHAELQALTDELTTLPNRRRLRMFLDQQLESPRRTKVSVVLFDLDGFKVYNDRYGHPAGDVMLCMFAEVLSRHVPAGGMPARYGGEEFVAVLVDHDVESALAFAERVRMALRAAQPTETPVTVSAGVATGLVRVASTNDLIVEADRALYRAKQEGRNRVCTAAHTLITSSKV